MMVSYLIAIRIGKSLELGRCENSTIKGTAHEIVYHALLYLVIEGVAAHHCQAVIFQSALALKITDAVCMGERGAAHILCVMIKGFGEIGDA